MSAPHLRSRTRKLAAGLLLASPFLLLAGGPAWAAGPQLYESGPAQDAAFIRFVNATGGPLDIVAGGRAGGSGSARRMTVGADKTAGAFMSIRPGAALQGRASQGGSTIDIAPKAAAGELLTVVFWPGKAGALGTATLAELPKDFNGLKASIAFYNLDDACADARLGVAGRDSMLFEHGAPRSQQRRPINPVVLSVQPLCGTQPVGPRLDLGTLEAGQRYSVFVVPGKAERTAFWARDELSP